MLYPAEQAATLPQQRFAAIRVSERGHLLTITLDRPAQKNALSPLLIRELAFALSYAHHERNVRAVVLEAAGDTFCAGADLKAFFGGAEATDSTIPMEPGEILPAELLRKVHRPVIARVQGDVFAGGFLLICGAAYVVAAETARFGLPEVKRGIWPMQVMASLAEVMPPRKALDFCLRARTVLAPEALELGLATHVVPPDALDGAVQGLAAELCAQAPAAVRLGLQAFDEMRRKAPDDVHPYLRQMLQQVLLTRDAQEGIRAFAEKRKPVWTGE